MEIRQALGFVFVGIMGTLLHFLYDWTGGSTVAALFSAVNESIWEHMKLLFYPAMVYGIREYFRWGKDRREFWHVKLFGSLTGLALIPAMYYTYTGGLGVSADWFNVTIFFLAAGVMFYLETRLFKRERQWRTPRWIPICLLLLIAVAFTVFTFFPPDIPLFQDPRTGLAGR